MARTPFNHTPGGPIYGCKYEAILPLYDITGALVPSASGLDAEISINGGTITDVSAAEETYGGGAYGVPLSHTEMTGNTVELWLKSTSAMTAYATLQPRRLPKLNAGTAQGGGTATITLASLASGADGAYEGCYVRITNNTPSGVQGLVGLIVAYDGANRVATVHGNWPVTPTSGTQYEILGSAQGGPGIAMTVKDRCGQAPFIPVNVVQISYNQNTPLVLNARWPGETSGGQGG